MADIVTFPTVRPEGYDPDLIWTPDANPVPGNPSTWQEPGVGYQAAGGGHFHQQLVVAGNKKVYYEAL